MTSADIVTSTTYYAAAGKENTDATLRLARKRAEELGIKTILVATTKGDTAVKAIEVFQGLRVVAVTHSHGFKGANTQELTPENRSAFEAKGGIVLTTTHAFGGVSRAVRRRFNTYQTEEFIANTLRILGQGMKVVCEIALMAADAGLARTDEDAIAIAGTVRGADTAVVLNPVNAQDFFNLKVKEVICKPRG